jgi:hypothetical protein
MNEAEASCAVSPASTIAYWKGRMAVATRGGAYNAAQAAELVLWNLDAPNAGFSYILQYFREKNPEVVQFVSELRILVQQ